MRYGPPTIIFMHGPIMLLSSLLWLLLFATLIWLLVRRFSAANRPPFPPFAAHQPGQPPFQPGPPLSALEILRQRYAHGEIDAATFDQMRERLEASERPRE
jgi:putative membrane protein